VPLERRQRFGCCNLEYKDNPDFVAYRQRPSTIARDPEAQGFEELCRIERGGQIERLVARGACITLSVFYKQPTHAIPANGGCTQAAKIRAVGLGNSPPHAAIPTISLSIHAA